MDEEKRQPFPTSWNEYNELFPERARLVKSYEAYGVLTMSDHDLFWDEQVYDNLKRALGVDNPVLHPGARLYFAKQQLEAKFAVTRRAESSIVEHLATITKQLPRLKVELEKWKEAEPDEYEKVKDLIEAIEAGKLEQFNHDKLVEILKRSIYHFPGIALSYQIRKNEEDIEEFNKAKPPEQPVSSRISTAKQRYEEYLKKQQG